MITRTETLTEASAPAFVQEGSLVDWPAIFAGGVVAAGVATIFTTFGAAIGMATVSPYDGTGSATLALIAAGLWIMWTTVSSVMVGGYIAGRMRRRVGGANADAVSVRDGIHGLAVWGIAILLGIWLVGAATDTATKAATDMVPVVTQAVTGTDTAANTTATTAPDAVTVAPQMTKAEVAAAAKKAKSYAVLAAFVSAASLLIAAAAAYWSAGLGGRHRDEDRVFARFGTWL